MMTCTSDRSGSASSGVRSSRPHAPRRDEHASRAARGSGWRSTSGSGGDHRPGSAGSIDVNARHAVGTHREREREPPRRWQAPVGGSDGKANSIVIAPHLSDGIGPCDSVTSCRRARLSDLRRCARDRSSPAGMSCMRVAVALRLASESIRNCPETTTAGPPQAALNLCVAAAFEPDLHVDRRKVPLPSATITTVRLPVRITASVGTTRASRAAARARR